MGQNMIKGIRDWQPRAIASHHPRFTAPRSCAHQFRSAARGRLVHTLNTDMDGLPPAVALRSAGHYLRLDGDPTLELEFRLSAVSRVRRARFCAAIAAEPDAPQDFRPPERSGSSRSHCVT